MFIVDLLCDAGHLFEGWYDNADSFAETRDGGHLSCPLCGSRDVARKPSFRGIASRASSRASSAPRPPGAASRAPARPTDATAAESSPPPVPLEVQRALSQLLRVVRAHAEDVGEAFAEKALAIHRGDEEARPIHGTSTPDEEARLVDEGVSFVKIPVPDIEQN